jgi:hypothetical protein
MAKDDRDDSLPPSPPLDPLQGVCPLTLADASTQRGINALAGQALESCGAVTQVERAIQRGHSPEQAIDRVLPRARGIVAEEVVAASFNRQAGLLSSPLTASRFEVPNHPLVDVVVRDAAGGTVQNCQLKFGTQDYVEQAVRSGKYSGPILTSREAAEALHGKLSSDDVTTSLEAGAVSTPPLSDSEVSATTRRVLERRFRRIEPLSSWDALGSQLKKSAPAVIGAAVLTAAHEVYKSVSTQQPVKADRVLRASLKAGGRALLVDQLGHIVMQFLEERMVRYGGWTQAAIKKASGWASPAAMLSTLVIDLAVSFWHLITGRLTYQEFLRCLTGRLGAVLVGALGAWVGYSVGSHMHPVFAVILTIIGGAVGSYYGEKWATAGFDRLFAPPAVTETPPALPA